MAQNVTLYNLLISCPGDIKEEVTLIESAVDEFNELYAETLGITIKTRHWSKSSYAQSGGKPQALLNEQFVNKCDAAVAIFWTRFGSPTDEYGSGTEEEIEIMLQSGKQVFMYFSDKPIPPSKINGDGYEKIQALSSLIEEWIVQNELTEKIYTETELLYVITELYLQICGDFRYQEHIQSICKKWIDGQTPMEINNKETIGIAEVESLCNKRISYEMNFLIGNICDLIEVDGENEEQVDQRNILTLLQKKVKYGVPNMTAISICESVFNDRLLAIELAQILSDANIGTDKILNMLKAHSEEIFSCLDSYPEYFKDRLSVLMK